MVAPLHKKPLNHDNLMNIILIRITTCEESDEIFHLNNV